MKRTPVLIALVLSGLLLPLLAVVAQSGLPEEQQKPPQIQKQKKDETPDELGEQVNLSARLVNVFFSVSDNQNALVTDIRREEVKVLENGQPQEIFTFARQTDLPLTIALLIDISGSQEYTLPEEKQAAAQFIRSIVRPGKDVVALLQFRDEVILVEDFTSTPNRLVSALNEVRFTPRTSMDPESKFGGTSLYDAVYLTSGDLLGKQPGRRTILLLTDGEDTTSFYKLQDAVDQSLRVEATVFSIGIGDRFRYGVDKKVLQRLSQETGGRAYFPTNSSDLTRAFREIENELRSQYLIAYYPSASAPGSYRTIEVRIPTRKNLKIRHRRGYYTPKPAAAGG